MSGLEKIGGSGPWQPPKPKDSIDFDALKHHLVHDPTKDMVNNPPHYTMGKIEVIEAIEDWKLPYHLGNAVKYIARAGRKDPSKEVEDLKKARWYLDRYIAQKENHE